MSTLADIEAAVTSLTPPQQWSLFEWLQSRLAVSQVPEQANQQERKQWLKELEQLRASTSGPFAGTPLQEIMQDLREDRC